MPVSTKYLSISATVHDGKIWSKGPLPCAIEETRQFLRKNNILRIMIDLLHSCMLGSNLCERKNKHSQVTAQDIYVFQVQKKTGSMG